MAAESIKEDLHVLFQADDSKALLRLIQDGHFLPNADSDQFALPMETPLGWALAARAYKCMETLIICGANMYVRSNGDMLVHEAARRKDTIAMRIFKKYFDSLVTIKDTQELTPLGIAIDHRDYPMISVLLDDLYLPYSHDLGLAKEFAPTDPGLQHAFHDTFLKYELYHACGDQNLANVVSCLQRGADPNFLMPKTGLSPLVTAVLYQVADIVKVLLEHGADPNFSDAMALIRAIKVENIEIFQYLLDAGGDVDKTVPLRRTSPRNLAEAEKKQDFIDAIDRHEARIAFQSELEKARKSVRALGTRRELSLKFDAWAQPDGLRTRLADAIACNDAAAIERLMKHKQIRDRIYDVWPDVAFEAVRQEKKEALCAIVNADTRFLYARSKNGKSLLASIMMWKRSLDDCILVVLGAGYDTHNPVDTRGSLTDYKSFCQRKGSFSEQVISAMTAAQDAYAVNDAVERGDKEAFDKALEAGGSFKCAGYTGQMPLVICLERASLKSEYTLYQAMAETLVEKGADLGIVTVRGEYLYEILARKMRVVYANVDPMTNTPTATRFMATHLSMINLLLENGMPLVAHDGRPDFLTLCRDYKVIPDKFCSMIEDYMKANDVKPVSKQVGLNKKSGSSAKAGP